MIALTNRPTALAVIDQYIEEFQSDSELYGFVERLTEARADIVDLSNAAGGALGDLLAMVAAADRGEVWVVNAGTRLRLAALTSAITRMGEAA